MEKTIAAESYNSVASQYNDTVSYVAELNKAKADYQAYLTGTQDPGIIWKLPKKLRRLNIIKG